MNALAAVDVPSRDTAAPASAAMRMNSCLVCSVICREPNSVETAIAPSASVIGRPIVDNATHNAKIVSLLDDNRQARVALILRFAHQRPTNITSIRLSEP